MFLFYYFFKWQLAFSFFDILQNLLLSFPLALIQFQSMLCYSLGLEMNLKGNCLLTYSALRFRLKNMIFHEMPDINILLKRRCFWITLWNYIKKNLKICANQNSNVKFSTLFYILTFIRKNILSIKMRMDN